MSTSYDQGGESPEGPQEAGSPASEGDVALGKLLRRLNVELDRFNVLFGDAHGLHHTDLNALVAILDAAGGGEPMTPSRLAAELDLSLSATTALLERLESLGHITRERSRTDRRRTELDVHDSARRVGGDFYRPLMRELGDAWHEFSDEQRETIRRFLLATIDATGRARETIERR
ncbi:DNA-binding transcriptional regulator, MarR family [Actinopolyspora xinjiangensis]|uniref:DNA-binding transcriptional regulator, MarR family n=1 Tax=Actinopolyspora xinjiangensis TaxID=405564 RepID=A0A1H0QDJ8_9ACTN|nr:helix-turn-helix domain-containing protein [Actinopolyspora xinjiangensis]SDP15432.1 DNA-binding transcriptional regulator, MarR family [Actinopolyspora xinjiangensis]